SLLRLRGRVGVGARDPCPARCVIDGARAVIVRCIGGGAASWPGSPFRECPPASACGGCLLLDFAPGATRPGRGSASGGFACSRRGLALRTLGVAGGELAPGSFAASAGGAGSRPGSPFRECYAASGVSGSHLPRL